ncbi:hypothetical protein GCM10009530_36000 [Microbispora corallina]|uniref:Secreted protein n=1 Tax=Microbispora corallina TaxID=83302 RepID=A0ABQ4FYJ1_9ACTN|nr:hypothetical protein [Microbispora corallina]GIH39863.1 hypothetical protein Mco01_28630 [Microbispora corallina]
MRSILPLKLTFVLVLAGLPAVGAATGAAAATNREIPAAGSTAIQPVAAGLDTGVQVPEIRGAEPGEQDARRAAPKLPPVNRSLSRHSGHHGVVVGSRPPRSNPTVALSFDGISHRDQRLANGGNQFSTEPPDQGLCAGNGFVLESVNDALRVFDSSGRALIGVADLNTFYGYPAAIDRATGAQGPFVTDPSCYYDPDSRRWFQVALTLEVDADTGDFTGVNHLDVAVSTSASPLGKWTVYRVAAQDDGTDGTPAHPGCPCLGDYPHIGADAFGFYVTTNEYEFFGDGYNSAQIYAFPKLRFVTSPASVPVVQYDTTGLGAGGAPGFTIWPAQSPSSQYAPDTEYLLSSDAAEEANGTGTSDHVIQWRLSGTFLLNTGGTPTLSRKIVPVGAYSIPPKADQKPGDFPLGQCVNDTTTPTPLGPGCWRYLLADEPEHDEAEAPLDSNDTRMQQVVYAGGKLWAALDTAVTVAGQDKAGVEWFVVDPRTARADKQGYLALAHNNLVYPAVGVNRSGRGVIAFTVAGADYYPSAGFASLDARTGAGDVQIAAPGKGPQDGFSGYKAFNDPPRPRWGDYGAAAADGDAVWIASEYIGQSCSLAQYTAAPLLTCGGTRTALANWGTRITRLTF